MYTNIGGQDVWVEPMTQEELDAQTIDPRSRMAEQSADPKRGPRITAPKELCGRRIYQMADLDEVGGLQLHMPNFKALMLNVSRNSYEKAQEPLDERFEIRSDEERLSCDYMENMAVAVVTAVCAVESFANEYLDDEEKGKRLTDEKLKVLLPDKFGVHRSSQRAWWPDFVELVKIRNEFVHEKGTVLHDARTKLAWNKLGKMRNSPHELSCEVIRYFLGEEQARWLEPFKEKITTLRRDRTLLNSGGTSKGPQPEVFRPWYQRCCFWRKSPA